MELSNEQFDAIVVKVIEQVLVKMPKVIGNLMAQQAAVNKTKKEFLGKYPEFKPHKAVLSSVIESIEGKDLTASFDEVLEQAVPEIRKRLKITEKLNFTDVKDFDSLDMQIKPEDNCGVL